MKRILLILIGLSQCLGGWAQQARVRPNVVLILTDDQGWGDLSLHGNPHLTTPHLDALARSGAQVERFFVSPLCAPTRASLLTGRYHPRTGTTSVSGGRERMRTEELTLGEVFKEAGYATGLFGKWHNGEHFPEDPNGQGFDEFLGFCAGHWNNYFDTELQHNQEKIRTKGFITDVLTDAALGFIEKNRSRPFFCYVPFNAPHSPFQVPDRYFEKYKAKGLDDEVASVYGMVENVDDNVGRILAHLKKLGLAENTLVVFLTDNGPNGVRFNGDMKGTKGSVDEGGHRVPFFVLWPGRIAPGTVVKPIAAHVDVLPTLTELCGVPFRPALPIDGVSLAGLLLGKTTTLPERVLFTHNTGHKIERLMPNAGAVRTSQYRWLLKGNTAELYDLHADPSQQTNRTATRPDVAQTLETTYRTWFADVTSGVTFGQPLPLAGSRTELAAPEASFGGGVRFWQGNGWANDYLVDVRNPADSVSWTVAIARSGRYRVGVAYACPEPNADAGLRVRIGAAGVEKKVPPFRARRIPSPDRVPRKEAYEQTWSWLPLGTLTLEAGTQRVVLEPVNSPEKLEIKAVRFERIN